MLCIVQSVATKIGLPLQYLYYFGICLVCKDPDADYSSMVQFHHFYEWVKSVILLVIKHSYQFHQFEQSMSVPISSNNCRLLWSTAVIFCHLRYRVLKSLLCASIQHFLGFLLIYYHLVSFECLLCSLFIICISVHLEPSAVTCCLCSWCCTRVWK